jgi:hypothetical protein
MENKLRPKYFKKSTVVLKKKNKISKKNKITKKRVKNNRNSTQRGGKYVNSCVYCIKSDDCTKNKKIVVDGKKYKKYCRTTFPKIWKSIKSTGIRHVRGSDEDFIRAILKIKKNTPYFGENEVLKTLKILVDKGILNSSSSTSSSQYTSYGKSRYSSQYSTKSVVNSIIKYVNIKGSLEKRKIALQVAKLLGY